MRRREFLVLGAAAGSLRGQRPTATLNSGAPVPPPPGAKITSSIRIGMLKGSLEERLLTAATAGIQSVELGREYADWDDAAGLKAKRLMQSFGMRIASITAGNDWKAAISVARKLECRQVILPGVSVGLVEAGDFAAKAEVTLVAEGSAVSDNLKVVKEAGNPYVRLLFDIYNENDNERDSGGDLLAAIKEAVDYTAVFRVADTPGRREPGTGEINYKEVYQTIQKAGYSRYVCMDYVPAGDPVASLIRAVDSFRAALTARPLVTSS